MPAASGTACVATRLEGVTDTLIENERNGLLVPPQDGAALQAAIRRCFEDREWARGLGVEARRTVKERYELGEAAQQYLKAYLELGSAESETGSIIDDDRACVTSPFFPVPTPVRHKICAICSARQSDCHSGGEISWRSHPTTRSLDINSRDSSTSTNYCRFLTDSTMSAVSVTKRAIANSTSTIIAP